MLLFLSAGPQRNTKGGIMCCPAQHGVCLLRNSFEESLLSQF